MVELDSKDLEQFVKFHTGENMTYKTSSWEKFKARDKLLLLLLTIAGLLAAAALFVLLTPVVDYVFNLFNLYIVGWDRISEWLLIADRGLGLALGLGLLSLLFLILARFRYVRNPAVYVYAGCPQCHEHELIRIRRYRRDRIAAFFGIHARRYACRNCTWVGVRLVGNVPIRYIEGQEVDNIDFGDVVVVSGEDYTLEVASVESSEEHLQ
jgi:hypothetical protein